MATRTPLILNQTTARIEELAAADTIPGFMVEGMFGRNVLINGDFRVWQRGTNFPAAASARYTADRWFAWAAGSTVQVDRMGADGTSLPPGIGVASRPQYAFRATVASVAGANNFVLLQQRVENVRTLSAGKATFSGLIWASNSSGIAVSFYQIFGTGGSESIVGTPVIVPTVANTWQYVTVTLDVPSIFGTTITDDSALWLNIWLDAGSSSGGAGGQKNGVYWFTNLQLERGASATAFERRSDALELMLCQRYGPARVL